MTGTSPFLRPAATPTIHGDRVAIADTISGFDVARRADRARKRPHREPSRRLNAAATALFDAIARLHGRDPETIPLPRPTVPYDYDCGTHHGAVRHEGRTYIATHRCDLVFAGRGEGRYRWWRAVVVLDDSHVVRLIPSRHRAAAAAIALYEAGGAHGAEAVQGEIIGAMPRDLVPERDASGRLYSVYDDMDFVAALRHRGRLYVYTHAGYETTWGDRFIIAIDESDIIDA